MRWFKHLSQAAEDEKLSEILELYGAEGYGIYWIILEKIAFLMDGTEKTTARYSVKKWSKFCGKSPKVFRKFLESFQKLLLFRVEICQNNSDFLIIDCPNLLKYRDEYSKKSGQPPDKLPKESGVSPDQETETETETDKKKVPKKKVNSKIIKKPKNITDQTWSDFETHRKNLKAPITQTVLNTFSKQSELAGMSLEDALIESISRGWRGFKAEWMKNKSGKSNPEIF